MRLILGPHVFHLEHNVYDGTPHVTVVCEGDDSSWDLVSFYVQADGRLRLTLHESVGGCILDRGSEYVTDELGRLIPLELDTDTLGGNR